MSVDEAKRMTNMGVEIDLKALGTVRVRELTLESIIDLGGDLMGVLQEIESPDKSDPKGKSGMKWIVSAIQNPKSLQTLKRIAAQSTSKKAGDFEGLGITDWLKWATAFKDVTNWDELQELFTSLLPEGMWRVSETENPSSEPTPGQ